MVFRNQDLGSVCTDCYWHIISPRHSQWIKLRNICMYVYTFISTSMYLQTENREFTPIPPTPVQHHRVHSSPHSPCIFVSPFPIRENLVSHWLLHVNFFAQFPYVINLPIPRGPVKRLPHEVANPCWLPAAHFNILPVAQLLPCYLPPQFTFLMLPSSSEKPSTAIPWTHKSTQALVLSLQYIQLCSPLTVTCSGMSCFIFATFPGLRAEVYMF